MSSDSVAQETYDLLIIGASAAGIPAAVYGARRKLKLLVVSEDFGGEMALSGEIENWPGVIHTTGIELSDEFRKQAKALNISIQEGVRIKEIKKDSDAFTVYGARDGEELEYRARTVILATGVHPRELGIPGEKELRAKGLSYCTVCDGPLFSEKSVATIGGGNSALESAIMMADIAQKVYVVNKNPTFKGDAVLVEKVAGPSAKKNIEVIYNALTTKILGDGFVGGVEYKAEDGSVKTLKLDGVFVHIGMVPNTGFLPNQVAKNEFGEIKIDKIGRTSVSGLFAAGDATDIPYKQLAIAAGQGVAAALAAVDYLNKN